MDNVKDEEELGYVRLGIMLPNDAVTKLDALKKIGMFASRGRTIQALVDAIWEIRTDANAIVKITQKDSAKTSDEYVRQILPWLMDIIRRAFVFGE